MKNLTFTNHKGERLTRVSKRRARKLFDAGYTIEMSPVNMNPLGAWYMYYRTGKTLKGYDGSTFDNHVNAFEYYNCNSECGKYAAYYVRSEVL